MGRVYAVASGKGGVGKTTTTVNLGAALAAAGHEVAVVDADLGMANVAGAFGVDLDPSAATVHDVLAGEASVADATYEGAGGVSVIPGSADVTAFARSDPEGLDDLLDALSGYDVVLLDTGASLTHVTVRPLAIADEVLLASTTERAALGDTDRTREVTNRVGGSVVGAVLTRVDPANPNAEEVTATLDAKVLEVVPEDAAVGASMAAGEPLELHAPGSQAAAAYRRLAALLSGDADPAGESAADVEERGDGEDADVDAEPEERSRLASTPSETGTDSGAPDADAPSSTDESDVDADSDAADGGPRDAAAGESGRDDDVAGTDRDDSTAVADSAVADAEGTDRDETASDEAGEDTVSETVLADEFARGLVEEAEPGDADGFRADEGGARRERSAGVPDAEGWEGDADEDGDGKGFFRRLLG